MAMAASIVLHLSLLVVLQPASPPQEERFSEHVVEVTLERALAAPAAPAPPALAEAGQARPAGSIDLVHTALAPGPTDSPCRCSARCPNYPPRWCFHRRGNPSTQRRSRPSCFWTSRRSRPRPWPGGCPRRRARRIPWTGSRRRRRCSLSDRRPARPRSRIAAAASKALARRAGPADRAAADASERDAQQDYVMQVVRKLSQSQFSTDATPATIHAAPSSPA